MPKVEIEIPQTELDLIREAAWKLGIKAEQLIQQEVDAFLTSVSVWIQRTA